MRRKPVPNPLSLADDSNSLGGRSPASTNVSTNASASALTYPDPSVLRADRPSPRPTLGSDTALQIISPTSSKSPKSPRSPFGKFSTAPTTAATNKPQGQQQGQQPKQQQQKHQPQPQPQQQHHHNQPCPVDVRQPLQSPDDVHVAQHRRQQSPHQHEPDYPPLTPLPPTNTTISTATETSSHADVEKHTRSASRFFNFGKGSRSNTQPLHSYSDHTSLAEAMSRGTENPAMSDRVSSKHSKNSGTSVRLEVKGSALILVLILCFVNN